MLTAISKRSPGIMCSTCSRSFALMTLTKSPFAAFIVNCCTRNIGLYSANLDKYAVRQAKMLAKLMTGSLHKKKNWEVADKGIDFSLPVQPNYHRGLQSARKIAMLNKVFMTYITELMASGEVASAIVGHGISISRVKVAADFGCVNVYWVAKGTVEDASLQDVLAKSASTLRHELTQLRVVGVVPKLAFIPDRQYAVVEEVEQRLARADMGDDYEPGDSLEYSKTESSLVAPVPHKIRDEITRIESSVPDVAEETLPPMRHDTLGLDHAAIMQRLQGSLKRSQAQHRREPALAKASTDLPQSWADGSAPAESFGVSDIAKFIKKRRLFIKKTLRNKNYQLEKEILEREMQVEYEDTDKDVKEEKDFIEEFGDGNYRKP